MTALKNYKSGIILLTHGGSDDRQRAISGLITELGAKYRTELCYGMSNIERLNQAAYGLIKSNCDSIHVIRLSIGSPVFNIPHLEAIEGLQQCFPEIKITWHGDGLIDASEIDQILLDRAMALSNKPAEERVLLLAHGAANDLDDSDWQKMMMERAQLLTETLRPDQIACMTLREDWPEKRQVAERRIREFISSAYEDGKQVLVIPFRLFGFGPYASVLEGLEYRANEIGLLPHPAIAVWINRLVENND